MFSLANEPIYFFPSSRAHRDGSDRRDGEPPSWYPLWLVGGLDIGQFNPVVIVVHFVLGVSLAFLLLHFLNMLGLGSSLDVASAPGCPAAAQDDDEAMDVDLKAGVLLFPSGWEAPCRSPLFLFFSPFLVLTVSLCPD